MRELPDHGDDQNRRREWQDDAPENTKEPGAIDARSSYQILRDGSVVVSAEQDGKGEPLDRMDHDQASQRIHQARIAQHDGPGKQAHLLGKEEPKSHDAVDPAIAAKAPERYGVTGDSTKQGGENRRGDRDQRGVQHVRPDAGAGLGDAETAPGRGVVAPCPLLRPADHRSLRYLLVGTERIQDDNSQWREPRCSAQRDDEIDQDPAWRDGSLTHGSPAAAGHSATLHRAVKPREE